MTNIDVQTIDTPSIRPLIITGMHRSGTSLVASAFQGAGVNIGGQLIGPDKGNSRGHYEDAAFNAFQNQLLERRGQTFLVQHINALGELTPEETDVARELIKQRAHQELWGWKDPRTCLFLPFWHGLLPNARFVFVYRHPLEVALSLLRRGKDFDLEALVNPLRGLRAWQTHNHQVLRFYREHSSQCFLAHITTVVADLEGFVQQVGTKLALPLRLDPELPLYREEELQQMAISSKALGTFQLLAQDADEVYEQLEGQADWPGLRPSKKISASENARFTSLYTTASSLKISVGLQDIWATESFALLLGLLDPKTILQGKKALDELRRARIDRLEDKLKEREQHNQTLSARITQLEQLIDTKESHLFSLTHHIQTWEQWGAEKDAQIRAQAASLDHLARQAADKDKQIEGWLRQAEVLVQQTLAKDAQITELAKQVEALAQQALAKDTQITELAKQAKVLTQQASPKEARITELSEHVKAQGAQFIQVAAQLKSLELVGQEKDAHIQELTTRVEDLGQLASHRESQIQQLTSRLGVIENSRWWGMALKWYAFRYRFNRLWSATRMSQPPAFATHPTPPPSPKPALATRPATPKVLFISHDAGRHGAQILLLNFLKWFKTHVDLPFEVLLKRGGELKPEFEALAPTHVWSGVHTATSDEVIHQHDLMDHFRRANIGLIYSNTITNGEVLAALTEINSPVITHVHELDYWMTYQTAADNNALVKRHTTRYIAVSQAVRQALVEKLQVADSQIDVIYGFVPVEAQTHADASRAQQLRQKLNIPSDAWVVGGSGTTDWRKGPDVFVQLAYAVCQHHPTRPVHFLWVGGANSGPAYGALAHDLRRLNLEEQVHFVGVQTNPTDFFANFDVFALVSREDPFPLVSMEAAALGKPVVCFDGSGGAKEFVEADSGFVIPYLDVNAMAERVLELLRLDNLRQQLGRRAAQKVRERHTIEVVGPLLVKTIKQLMLPLSR